MKDTPVNDPFLEFIRQLRVKFSARVIDTWLLEFGYPTGSTFVGLSAAVRERGPRIARELDAHGKRLADRATMSRAPVGRAGVIPR